VVAGAANKGYEITLAVSFSPFSTNRRYSFFKWGGSIGVNLSSTDEIALVGIHQNTIVTWVAVKKQWRCQPR